MATIVENLQIIKNSTTAIKQAIISKGGTIKGDITTWASAINEINSDIETVTSKFLICKCSYPDTEINGSKNTCIVFDNIVAGDTWRSIANRVDISERAELRIIADDNDSIIINFIDWNNNSSSYSLENISPDDIINTNQVYEFIYR